MDTCFSRLIDLSGRLVSPSNWVIHNNPFISAVRGRRLIVPSGLGVRLGYRRTPMVRRGCVNRDQHDAAPETNAQLLRLAFCRVFGSMETRSRLSR